MRPCLTGICRSDNDFGRVILGANGKSVPARVWANSRGVMNKSREILYDVFYMENKSMRDGRVYVQIAGDVPKPEVGNYMDIVLGENIREGKAPVAYQVQSERRLGNFSLSGVLNPNVYGEINGPCDSYLLEGDSEEMFLTTFGLLENFGKHAINLTGNFPSPSNNSIRTAFYQVGDCAVSLCVSPKIPSLQVSIHNQSFGKRIKTLEILNHIFSQRRSQ